MVLLNSVVYRFIQKNLKAFLLAGLILLALGSADFVMVSDSNLYF